ncbi:hypothetical protein J6590_068305 [Homalodisca vitripennis]|nr:hypothetical protein J6590_068305 [Homalodisca vitripennis]
MTLMEKVEEGREKKRRRCGEHSIVPVSTIHAQHYTRHVRHACTQAHYYRYRYTLPHRTAIGYIVPREAREAAMPQHPPLPTPPLYRSPRR